MYRVTKADKNLIAPNNVVHIPPPTRQNRQWVQELYYDEECAIEEACREGNLWCIQFAVKRGHCVEDYSNQGLIAAIENNNLDVIRLLHANGADLNAYYDEYPLVYAAREGNIECFKLLLELGADLKTVLDDTYESDQLGIKKMMTQIGGYWNKISPTSINRFEYHEPFDKNDEYLREIRTTFNFKSRKIMTTIQENEHIGGPFIERFSDQDSFDEIIEAHTELQKQGGQIENIGNYTGKCTKTAKTAVQPITFRSAP